MFSVCVGYTTTFFEECVRAFCHCVMIGDRFSGSKSVPEVIEGFVKRAGFAHLAKMGCVFPRHSTQTTTIVDFPSHRVG